MQLSFIQGAFTGKDVDLSDTERFTIGRAEGSDLRVPDDDKRSSRQHAEIILRDGYWFIRDLNSSNGVWIDGQQITDETLLRDGQTVRVGAQYFQVAHASHGGGATPPDGTTKVGEKRAPDTEPQQERERLQAEERARRERQERERRDAEERAKVAAAEAAATERHRRENEQAGERQRQPVQRQRGYTTIFRRQNRQLRVVTVVAAVAVLVALGVGVAAAAGVFSGSTDKGLDVPALVESVQPSTVIVIAHLTPDVADRLQASGDDKTRSGNGSGFVLDADSGEIITNGHVTDGGQLLKVALSKDKERDTKVVAENFCNDVTLLKTSDTGGLKTLPTVSQKDLSEGDPVVAVGFPGTGSEDDNLVTTTGVISVVKSRHDATYPNTVQTDAAINPGNSGGPLLNADGNVVGINTISSGSEGSQNQNFAISSDHILSLLPELRRGVSTGYTGWVMDWEEDPEKALEPAVTTDNTMYYGPLILGPVQGQMPSGQLVGVAGGHEQYLVGIDGTAFGPGDDEALPVGVPQVLCAQFASYKKKTGDTLTFNVLDVNPDAGTVATFDQQIKLR